MATDDKSKGSKGSGDPPRKKKKKRPASAPGSESGVDAAKRDEAAKRAAAAAAAARRADAGDADAEADAEPADASDEAEASAALAVRGGESASIDQPADGEELGAPRSRPGQLREPEEGAPAQLGAERYVLAAFFAAGLLGAYIMGRIVHGIWADLANRNFFVQSLPSLAAVQDDTKLTISTIIGGIGALALVVHLYRRPDIRTWADDVAAELTKVKWPTKKDVTNSTLVVIAASTVATVYLALLDRLWAFVTNLVYGTGS